MRIRWAQPSDAAFIAETYAPFVTNHWTSFETVPPDIEEIRTRMDAAGEFYPWLIIEDEAGQAGYAYASPHRTRAAYRTSVDTAIYVASRALGKGYGTRIYAALLTCLTHQNYNMAFAGISLPNPASLALHVSLGFTEVGRYPNVGFKQGEWRDTVWLGRPLAEPQTPPARILPLAEIDFRSLLA